MEAKTHNNRIQELDALRGIAALMVVLFHYNLEGEKNSTSYLNYGVTGVDLFFIISGFVIFMSLNKVKDSTTFLINRVSRLYPVYWTCVTFTFLIICLNNKHIDILWIIKYLGNLTMFQFYLKISDIDGPYWTMIIEMIFYIGMLILLKFNKVKSLTFIGLLLSILVAISCNLFFQNILIKKLIYYIPFLQFIPLFFAGTIFYKVYNGKKSLTNYVILITCLIAQVSLHPFAGRYKFYISQNEYAIFLSIYFLLFSLFVNMKLTYQ